MATEPDLLSEIFNYRFIGDQLATAGQPTAEQFNNIRNAGYDLVINLALPTSDNALTHEGSVVTNLGMTYVHIPVTFDAPTSEDFTSFCRVMTAFEGKRVFIHCAANKRVSVFVFLYRVLIQHTKVAEAKRDMFPIWQPDEVWSRFIQTQLESEPGEIA